MKYFLLFLVLAIAATLGSLAIAQPLDRVTPLEDLAIVPTRTPPPVAFDANAGSYTRTITKPAPLFSGTPDPFSGVTAFQGRDSASPSFDGQYSVGQGEGGRFTGGSIAEWKDAVRKGPVVLIIFGGLAILGGIVLAVVAKQFTLGLAVAGAGLVLVTTGILFESYPWIALVAFGLVLAVGVWWVWNNRSLTTAKTDLTATVGKLGTALKTVVKGVEAAPADAQAAVKAQIGTVAAGTADPTGIKMTVTALKNGTAPGDI